MLLIKADNFSIIQIKVKKKKFTAIFTFRVIYSAFRKTRELRLGTPNERRASYIQEIFLNVFGGYIHLSHCGTSDTPVVDFFVMSPLGFKARVGSLIYIVEAKLVYILGIHLWCLLIVSLWVAKRRLELAIIKYEFYPLSIRPQHHGFLIFYVFDWS